MQRRRLTARGFTLIEAMVVLAMLGIVAAIATPNYRSFIGTMNTKAVAFDLINDLAFARSEAIKLNRSVRLEPPSGDWAKGWTVSSLDVDGTVDETLREHGALSSSIEIGGIDKTLTFLPNGRLGTNIETANRVWSVKSSIEGVTARCVVVTLTGAARSQNGGC
jgi:type IV fimbrial biogenesis protein FimT